MMIDLETIVLLYLMSLAKKEEKKYFLMLILPYFNGQAWKLHIWKRDMYHVLNMVIHENAYPWCESVYSVYQKAWINNFPII